MKKFVVKTLGCKANYSDGQLLEVGLLAQGFESTQDLTDADLIVVNSCTVTDEADRQSQKMARDLHRKNPNAKIIYTGCAAEVNPELALKIKGVSAVVGNQNKDAAPSLISDFFRRTSSQGRLAHPTASASTTVNATSDVHEIAIAQEAAVANKTEVAMAAVVKGDSEIPFTESTPEILGSVSNYGQLASKHPVDREWALPEAELSTILKLNSESSTFRTRAFIKVQEGCDSFCTYCIIPYGRGPARSLPIETIVAQINALVESGFKEVILTGTNIGDYGLDFSDTLQIDALLEEILSKTKLERLRIGSLDPTEISDRMLALLEKYEAFCPHFHVSLQHTGSKILKLMKRKYSGEQAEEMLWKLSQHSRKPFIGMDLITGFPGETAADFELMLERLKSLPWQRLHVFPYSERSGTPATKLPGKVAPEVRKVRAKELQSLSLERLTSHYAQSRATFGDTDQALLRDVLLESFVKGPDGTQEWMSGYARNYQRVLVPIKNTALSHRNQVVDIAVSRWLVDRASGEVSWLGELLA